MLRLVRLITIVGLRPCPHLSEFVLNGSVFDSLSFVDINDGKTIASLTGHALYDVWHHLIGKPLYLTTISWRFQKNSTLGPFSKTCAYGAGKRPLRVEGGLK